jgi:hypothetical protein
MEIMIEIKNELVEFNKIYENVMILLDLPI